MEDSQRLSGDTGDMPLVDQEATIKHWLWNWGRRPGSAPQDGVR